MEGMQGVGPGAADGEERRRRGSRNGVDVGQRKTGRSLSTAVPRALTQQGSGAVAL